MAATALAGVLVQAGCGAEEERAAGGSVRVAGGGPAFVDEALCAGCHAEEARLWTGSHHDLAMQDATEATVLGDFGGDAELPPGPARRFFRGEDGAFLVHAEGADGELAVFEITHVFGVEPLQQYLARFPDGRLQCMTVAWDVERERWFSLYPEDEAPAGDALHWTGRYQTWNTMCAECHSTGLVKGYDAERDAFETTYERIDVGCQACHGPGADHVVWADRGAEEDGSHGFVTRLAKGDAGAQLDACARCHARRASLREVHEHGAPFLDGYAPERLREGLYHADGQILDEVYVYGSFVQSRMHRAGVACTDCHEPHSLEPLTPGNSLCSQCHSPLAPVDRFPGLLAKDYDDPSHHFHPEGSSGSSCVECHMPARTYMQVDPRRDHSFRVPRPDLAARTGAPDACTACHADRDAEWAAERVAEWYGPRGREGPEPAEVLARARDGAATDAELAEVAADPDLAGIARATAVDHLSASAAGAVRAAAGDGDGLLRAAAADALARLAPVDRLAIGAPLLDDPLRSVRVAAARVLGPLAAEDLPAGARASFERAWAEHEEARALALDTPAGRFDLAADRQAQGDVEGAVRAYSQALAMDPAFLPARFNLATLLSVSGRGGEALGVLEEGVRLAPGEGELWFSLGLLRAELDDLEGAAQALGRAARRVPDRPRLHYNLGVALWRLGRLEEAEAALRIALERAPGDAGVQGALDELRRLRGSE